VRINISQKYQKIWQLAEPILKKCRPDDLIHCKQAAELVADFIKKYHRGDPDILVPVAIFHDIGHAVILPEHFDRVSGPNKLPDSKLVHMLTGAKIAKDLLQKIHYPSKKIKEIVEIISTHDIEDKKLFNTENKKIFNDLDTLDRFSLARFRAIMRIFKWSPEETCKYLEKSIPNLFTLEVRKMARQMLNERKKEYKV